MAKPRKTLNRSKTAGSRSKKNKNFSKKRCNVGGNKLRLITGGASKKIESLIKKNKKDKKDNEFIEKITNDLDELNDSVKNAIKISKKLSKEKAGKNTISNNESDLSKELIDELEEINELAKDTFNTTNKSSSKIKNSEITEDIIEVVNKTDFDELPDVADSLENSIKQAYKDRTEILDKISKIFKSLNIEAIQKSDALKKNAESDKMEFETIINDLHKSKKTMVEHRNVIMGGDGDGDGEGEGKKKEVAMFIIREKKEITPPVSYLSYLLNSNAVLVTFLMVLQNILALVVGLHSIGIVLGGYFIVCMATEAFNAISRFLSRTREAYYLLFGYAKKPKELEVVAVPGE